MSGGHVAAKLMAQVTVLGQSWLPPLAMLICGCVNQQRSTGLSTGDQ